MINAIYDIINNDYTINLMCGIILILLEHYIGDLLSLKKMTFSGN